MLINCPLIKLERWLDEERLNGNIFPQGAALCTVSKDGNPRSRMVGTMLDEQRNPVFHTSPASRKVEDIAFFNKASLTYSFQRSLRSSSIEGSLCALNDSELDRDWLKFDADFRRHYVVFGGDSGSQLTSMESLRNKRSSLDVKEEEVRPDSFIGYRLVDISRVSFYSVKEGDFAESVLYERESDGSWLVSDVVP